MMLISTGLDMNEFCTAMKEIIYNMNNKDFDML